MRHSKTIIYGSGILNRIKLKQADGYIYGNISIRTSNDNIVSFNVYHQEFTKSGKPNPSYKCFLTVMNEYKDSISGEPDYVEISLNDKYPNSEFYFRDGIQKNVKFIKRIDKKKSGFVFKVFGVRVNSINGSNLECKLIGYDKKIKPIKFVNQSDFAFNVGDVVDVVGYIREGLDCGKVVDELRVKNARISELELNFDSAEEENFNDDPF